MKNYEIMYIVRSTLSKEEIQNVSKYFEEILKKSGAKNTRVIEIGQKELAYEVKKQKTGFYYLVTFTADNDEAVNEFDRLALLSKDVLRHLITNRDK